MLAHPTDKGAVHPGRGKLFAVIGASVAGLLLVVAAIFLLKGSPQGLLYVEIPTDAGAGVRVNLNGKEYLDDGNAALKPGPHLIPVNAGRASVMVVVDGYETLLETVEVKEGNEYTRLISKLTKKK